MKPRTHRVCTFSRLFSDFQNSLALRNTTESSLTEGRSCFALWLIGQDKEMSVFFPHLSKAEHVRQTKKYPGNLCFPRLPAPCETEHRRQPGRPYFGTFDHTGADSVSRLHLGKGRKRSPDVFCCPEFVDGTRDGGGCAVNKKGRCLKAVFKSVVTSPSSLLRFGKQIL